MVPHLPAPGQCQLKSIQNLYSILDTARGLGTSWFCPSYAFAEGHSVAGTALCLILALVRAAGLGGRLLTRSWQE